jgi:hypothetical protein
MGRLLTFAAIHRQGRTVKRVEGLDGVAKGG